MKSFALANDCIVNCLTEAPMKVRLSNSLMNWSLVKLGREWLKARATAHTASWTNLSVSVSSPLDWGTTVTHSEVVGDVVFSTHC